MIESGNTIFVDPQTGNKWLVLIPINNDTRDSYWCKNITSPAVGVWNYSEETIRKNLFGSLTEVFEIISDLTDRYTRLDSF